MFCNPTINQSIWLLTTKRLLQYMFRSSHFFSFDFWYFDHFSCMIFFPLFFCLAHLALQNVNKDYAIFSYFCIFSAKSDQKPKTKNGMKHRSSTDLTKLPIKATKRLEHYYEKKNSEWYLNLRN